MATATFDFTGTNGAAWPAAWSTAVSGTGAAATINTNRGGLTSNSTPYNGGAKAFLTGIASRDVDITLDVTFPAIVEEYMDVELRSDDAAPTAKPNNSYFLEIFPHNGTATMGVSKRIGGALAPMSGDLTAGTWTANTARRIRFSAIGNTLSVKIWDPASAEPGTWLWTGTDTDLAAATGGVLMTMTAGSTGTAQTAYVDNVSVTYTAASATRFLETFDNVSLGIWTPSTAGAGAIGNTQADNFQSVYGIDSNVPAATGDRAGLSTTFTGVPQASVEGWWKVTTEGASSSSNVPFARLFSGSQRLADVYRQNVSAGSNVWLRVTKAAGGSNYWFISTGTRLELNTWVYVKFVWGIDGNPYVWINGTQVLGPANKPTDWFAATSIDTAWLGSQEVGNQGAWAMDAITLTTYPTAVTQSVANGAYGQFSGSGTLSTTQKAGFTQSASLSGSGTLSAVVTGLTTSRTAALSGSGTLSGVQTAAALVKSVPLSGTGTLSKAVVVGFTASMSSSSTGTLTTATSSMSVQAAFFGTGSGTLGGSGAAPAITQSVALSGSGTLSAAVVPRVSITAPLSGVGNLTSSSSNSFNRTATLSGSGTLAGVITGMSLTRSVALSGSGTLSTGTVNNKAVSADLSGSGAFVPYLTAVGFTASQNLSGSGTLSGTSIVNRMAAPQLSGSGTLTAVVKPSIMVDFVQVGSSMLVVDLVPAMKAEAQLAGVGVLAGDTSDQLNYDVTAYLAEKRWSGSLGSQRWKGSL